MENIDIYDEKIIMEEYQKRAKALGLSLADYMTFLRTDALVRQADALASIADHIDTLH